MEILQNAFFKVIASPAFRIFYFEVLFLPGVRANIYGHEFLDVE